MEGIVTRRATCHRQSPIIPVMRSSLMSSYAKQAFKHVFLSPTLATRDSKAVRLGNARIHGMKQVTRASIAYIAMQVSSLVIVLCIHKLIMNDNLQTRFALSSTSVFSWTDPVSDSTRFYTSVLDLLDEPEEQSEVNDLLQWWNR